MSTTSLSTGFDAAALLEQTIDFIPNEDFEGTLEAEVQEIEAELYAEEEQSPGSLYSDHVAASLLAPLQDSRLLTFEGEQFLFKRLNFLRFRANAIQATLNSKRPAKKKVRELDRLLSEAAETREELAKANLRLVVSIAGKLSISREEFDEFVAEGNAIMVYAIDKFDFSREAEIMASEPSIEIDPTDPTESDIKAVAAAVIAKMDETLDERERVIVRRRFGLDGSGESKTFNAIGDELGLSKERVRQLLQRSIEKLGQVAKPFESLFAPM